MKDANLNKRTYVTMLGGALILMAAATAGTMRDLEISQNAVVGQSRTFQKVSALARSLEQADRHSTRSAPIDDEAAMEAIERIAHRMGCSGDLGSIRPQSGPGGTGMIEIEMSSPDAGKALEFLQAVEKESGIRTRGISLKRQDMNGRPSLFCVARMSR